jgi:hypothetical protein
MEHFNNNNGELTCWLKLSAKAAAVISPAKTITIPIMYCRNKQDYIIYV